MDRRLELHHLLKETYEAVTGTSSEWRVFYQSPGSVLLKYPCMIYKLEDIPVNHANNLPYRIEHSYELKVIDKDPISPLREAIVRLPKCKFVRSYVSDNLYHYVFRIYD